MRLFPGPKFWSWKSDIWPLEVQLDSSGQRLLDGWGGIVPKPSPSTRPPDGSNATNRSQSPNDHPNPKNPRKSPGSCICRCRVDRVSPVVFGENFPFYSSFGKMPPWSMFFMDKTNRFCRKWYQTMAITRKKKTRLQRQTGRFQKLPRRAEKRSQYLQSPS